MRPISTFDVSIFRLYLPHAFVPHASSPASSRRGLTLLELMLALSVTAIVAMAMSGMMGAVSSGVGSHRDMRRVMVLANAGASRLSAYIAPSRCVLDVDGANVVLWFSDSRQSNTVHATEVRWLRFDNAAGTVVVHYVDFPDAWTQAACDLADLEYPASSNWDAVLSTYQAAGWTSSRTLIDSLASVSVTTEKSTDLASRYLSYELGFQTEAGVVPITVAATIVQHSTPVN